MLSTSESARRLSSVCISGVIKLMLSVTSLVFKVDTNDIRSAHNSSFCWQQFTTTTVQTNFHNNAATDYRLYQQMIKVIWQNPTLPPHMGGISHTLWWAAPSTLKIAPFHEGSEPVANRRLLGSTWVHNETASWSVQSAVFEGSWSWQRDKPIDRQTDQQTMMIHL